MTQAITDLEKPGSVQATTKKIVKGWLVWLIGSVALFSISIFVIFSWTNVFRNAVLSNLVLRNGSRMFNLWQDPPVHLTYKFRIFNYTNFDEFSKGMADKLRVKEIGPYIYKEYMSRVNPVVHDNGTITYQEYRRFEYVGGRSEDETLLVPNIPLFMYMAGLRDMSNTHVDFVTRAFNLIGENVGPLVLGLLQYEPFIKLKVKDFLWGYDDNIISVIKQFDPQNKWVPFEKFGMFAMKVGLSKDDITVYSGSENLEHLGLIRQVNRMESRHVWKDKDCDKIYGTDGSMFPPHLIRDPNATLSVYFKDMCRTMPLKFDRESFAQGMPTLRYKLPDNVFNASAPENSCFCSSCSSGSSRVQKSCPPAGIFNGSACLPPLSHGVDAPLLTSFPHFYLGEESLFEKLEGLKPNQSLHESYVDIHPRLAVPVAGWSRIQINVETRRAKNDPCPTNLKDGTILPILWVEVGPENFPESVLSILHQAVYTAGYVEAGLQWGSFLATFVSCLALLHIVKGKKFKRPKTLQRNTSGQNPLIAE